MDLASEALVTSHHLYLLLLLRRRSPEAEREQREEQEQAQSKGDLELSAEKKGMISDKGVGIEGSGALDQRVVLGEILMPIDDYRSSHYVNMSTLSVESNSFSEAFQDVGWYQAVVEESDVLLSNSTWDLVLPSPSANLIGCRWFYKVKRKADGSLELRKARIVA
uniref:Mitochondrial protein n=1 Tax=Ananas comosus var. bracteatus TaxID=296719 RepID=A0A6V7PQ73_ANACO|nr:unnamed protein product [Ananas comosus var. bracteatus]